MVIIEAASFNRVVINIGVRQNLRERSNNVIDVDCSYEAISSALQQALALPPQNYENIYGDGKTSQRCCDLLTTLSLNAELLS